ncbi:hypothetical protein [Streptomyces sp. MST-110588]|uniref:hypothetical protein n=1 Tax=Streptomyces sp. MST-110588 TaxID=2833628 RepID=UPI001F5DCB29|nr:hypothetical protein [Streptomyces sp. MST-110588]UNO38911.1 hypothetical protein KGS77_03725 [Streptomyces sp. MST-110588]
MTNAQMWALILGFASPMLIAIVNQPQWSRAVRTGVQVVISVLVGLGSAYFAGDFAGKDVVTGILVAAVAAISAYKGVFKPSGIAPKVEKATSPAPRG